MPYVNVKTNVKIEDKAALMKKLSEVITIIPEKTPERTMIQIDTEQDIYFGDFGEPTDPCAMVQTLVNNTTDYSTIRDYGNAVLDLLSQTCGISDKRIYLTVSTMETWVSRK